MVTLLCRGLGAPSQHRVRGETALTRTCVLVVYLQDFDTVSLKGFHELRMRSGDMTSP